MESDEVTTVAEAALVAAQQQNWAGAVFAMWWLTNHRDRAAIGYAIQLWIDAHVEHSTGGQYEVEFGRAELVAWDMTTVERAGDGDLTPQMRWVMRAMHARATRNRFEFESLCAALPKDGTVRASYIWTLLITCARTITDMPYGYATAWHR